MLQLGTGEPEAARPLAELGPRLVGFVITPTRPARGCRVAAYRPLSYNLRVQVSVVSGELTRGWYRCDYDDNFSPYLLATLSRHQSLPVLGVVASY